MENMTGEEPRYLVSTLQAQSGPKQWDPPRIKMEEPEPSDGIPHVVQAGRIGEFLQLRPGEDVKQEVGEDQWEAFLKRVDSSHADWGLREAPTPWDDTKGFLVSFEQVAKACRWPKGEWVTRLLPALSGPAQQAFSSLGVTDRENYRKVKVAILREAAARRERLRQHFRHFCYQEAEGPRGAYNQLQERCHQWLRVENSSKEQILERLILEQFLTVLPPEIQRWVRERSPETGSQAVILAEVFLQRQEEAAGWWQQQGPVQVVEGAASPPQEKPPSLVGGERQLFREVKQEESVNTEALSHAKKLRLLSVGAGNLPEQSEPGAKCGTSKWRRENVAQFCSEQGNASGIRHKADVLMECHQEEMLEEAFLPRPGVPKRSLSSPAVPQESHIGPEQMNECDKNKIQLENLDPMDQLGSREGEAVSQGKGLEPVSEDHGRLQWPKRKRCRKKRSKSVSCTAEKVAVTETPQEQPQNSPLGSAEGFGKTRSQPNRFSRALGTARGRLYKCSHCPKAFDRFVHCLARERTHGRRKPSRCSLCGLSFSRNWLLTLHERTHVGKKPYKCSSCEKSFSWKSQLIVHERAHVQKEPCIGDKPYKCSVCEESFSHRWLHAMHEGIHAGEKPYECSWCGKRFYSDLGLIYHERFHAAEAEAV